MQRRLHPAANLRAAIGFMMRRTAMRFVPENRISPNTICFLTGRTRGTSKRFTLTRVRYRHEASAGLLFGLRKSS
jgi:ribosomal protein S14